MNHFRIFVRSASRATLVAVLCASQLGPAALAAAIPPQQHAAALTPNQKTLQALNRFAFGPRPGDEAAVRRMGLEAWFQRQLHPETIDDSAFQARLDAFPAMKLTTTELIERFPGPLYLRGMLARGEDTYTSSDPIQNAIYADAIARYKIGLQVRAAAGENASTGAVPAAKGGGDPAEAHGRTDAGVPAKAEAEQKAVAGNNKLDIRNFTSLPVSTLSAADIRAIVQLAPQARFDRIVALSPQDNIKFSLVTAGRTADVMQGWTPAQREAYAAMQSPQRVIDTEVLGERILRDTYSERQLQAVLTDFWLNHFSVYSKKNGFMPWLLNSYERDAILPNSLGNFEQMLIATAQSPAMLLYLDNWESIGPNSQQSTRLNRALQYASRNPKAAGVLAQAPKGINENYARELMELHTVGVNGGYTQKDVIEVAKCFTGWTINRAPGQKSGQGDTAGPYTFVFDKTRHEPGPKTVLGVTIPEGGMEEGMTVLHMLANSPQTARFVSQKLAVRFVADHPPKALVDAMAATFLKTHGDIKAVMTTMFHAPGFWATENYRAKIKTPIEFMVSALRASETDIQNPTLLIQAVDLLGMPIYGMQTPQGYSWNSEDWISSGALVNRMNFALVLAGDGIRGAQTNWTKLLGDTSQTADPSPATEKELETLLLGQPASAKTRSAVLDQSKNTGMQEAAAKSLNLREPASGEGAGDGTGMASQGPSQRQKLFAAYQKRKDAGNGRFSLQPDAQETPLDTMAGLLLGSPDFQRR